MLPEGFEPSAYTVIVGRGKAIRETVGNRRLQVLARCKLREYEAAANDKSAKTKIVNSIMSTIKKACQDDVAFVRRTSDGRWWQVHDSVAREKCGYVFRDLLSDRYASSSKSKIAKRKLQESWLKSRETESQYGDCEEEHPVLAGASAVPNNARSCVAVTEHDEKIITSTDTQPFLSTSFYCPFSGDLIELAGSFTSDAEVHAAEKCKAV